MADQDVQDLIYERQFWREAIACRINSLVRAIEGDGRIHIGPKLPKSALFAELTEWVGYFDNVLGGEFHHATCEGCSKPVRPGEICMPYTDVTCHADCEDPAGIKPDGVKAGDRIPVGKDLIEVEEGEENPGYVVAYAETDLYDDDQIAGILAKARAAIAQATGGAS